MAVYYRTHGFILTKRDLREADQILNIYTEDFGKLEVLGKAIRKIKSKLRSGAELFYLSEIEFIQGKNYKTLTDAITTEKFKNVKRDLEKLKVAYQIAEIADNLIRGQEKDEKIWNLLNEVFEKLNNYSLLAIHYPLIYYYFLWNLLSISGYQIDLYYCIACQKKLHPRKLYFNPEKGGIICSRCHRGVKEENEITPEVIKILRFFLKKDWKTLLKLKMNDSYKKSLESISENYFSCIQNHYLI